MTGTSGVGPADVVAALSAAGRVLVALTARSIAQLDIDLTLPQYRMLVVLGTGAQRAVDLATELGVSPSTVTRTCDRLVRRGLVSRYRRTDDRRASWVALTDEGRQLIAAVMRQRRAEIVRLVDGADVARPRAVAAGLAAFVAAAGDVSEDEWWRRWRTAAATEPPRDG